MTDQTPEHLRGMTTAVRMIRAYGADDLDRMSRLFENEPARNEVLLALVALAHQFGAQYAEKQGSTLDRVLTGLSLATAREKQASQSD